MVFLSVICHPSPQPSDPPPTDAPVNEGGRMEGADFAPAAWEWLVNARVSNAINARFVFIMDLHWSCLYKFYIKNSTSQSSPMKMITNGTVNGYSIQ
jgi:hypothetical protein